MSMPRFLRVFIVPGAVFQSVLIAGGYGTGREIVQFYTQFGGLGGLMAIGVSTVCFAIVVSMTFEIARRYGVYNYRDFFRLLLGRAAFLFEFIYVTGLLLILAVIGSASGNIVEDRLGVPRIVGMVIVLLAVTLINFYGRNLITRLLTLWSVFLYAVLIAYVGSVITSEGTIISQVLAAGDAEPGWLVSGFQFMLYNVAITPIILYAARDIETSREAVGAGMLAAVIGMVPALLFHITFLARYPAVVEQELPAYWIISDVGFVYLMPVYIVMLFGTFIETGAGFIQGLIERLDAWSIRARGRPLERLTHGAIAGACLIVSLSLATLGIIRLIAQGYGSMAWVVLAIYVVPLLTVGSYRIFRKTPAVE